MRLRSAWIWATLLLATIASTPGCEPTSGKRIVLRISAWGGASDDFESFKKAREVYDEFERQNPGVEIQLENTPGSQDYVRKMLLSFVAGAEPDVMRLDASSAAVFINNGVLMDLQPLIAKTPDFSLNDYYENVVDITRRGDAVYAIPVDFTPMVIYYNKRLFDQAGVPYPQPGWTWDDFLTTAKAMTNKEHYGFSFTNWMPGWLPWIWAGGGDVLGPDGKAKGTADSPATVEAVTFLRDLINQHQVAPSMSQMAAEGANPFTNLTVAMEFSGHWRMMDFRHATKLKLEDVGVAPLPVKERGMAPVTVIYESGWSIGKNCKHPEIAWKFIQYYTSREVQRIVQSEGIGVCARKDIAEERAADEREQIFLDIIPSGRKPWGAVVEGYDYVEAEGARMMDSVLKSGRDPQQALNEFAAAVDRQLEKP